ncbi:MAG: hypothetical protein HFK04_00220 [Oscillospiraceae bacterium]|nr:hypothetical protein [Oscillospiraceae bacterium]
MQLLKITNVPIEYNFSIEPARLEMKQSQNPRHRLIRDPSQMNIDSHNIEVRLDSTELRASLNLRNLGEFARYYGQKGNQTAYQTIGENVHFGNQMAQIQDGVTISEIMRQKVLEQPTTYTTFLPSAGTDISWQPQQLNLDYDPGSVNFDWEVMRNVMDYVPGKFQMHITQYPEVQIEYLGEPRYVPPSSSPTYEEESA